MGSVRRSGSLASRLGVALVLAALLSPAIAPAAAGPWAGAHPLAAAGPEDTVRRELEATDRVIERARDQVSERSAAGRLDVTSQAGAFLQKAVTFQQEARGHFRDFEADLNERDLDRALRMTKTARELAIRAIELSQVEFKAHESLQTLLEQTRELVIETREVVGRSAEPEATHLLESGEDQLRRADEAFRDRKFRQAIRLAVISRDLLRRAQDEARGTGAEGLPSAESALDATDTLLEEVTQALRRHPSSREIETMLESAGQLQRRARRALHDGRLRQARILTRMARERALGVLMRVQQKPRTEDLEASLALLEDIHSDLRAVSAEEGDDVALRLLDEGREHLVKARQALDEDKPAVALREARAANTLLRQVSERMPDL